MRLIVYAAAAALSLGAFNATAAENPRREQERLTRTDNALARSAVLRGTDLPAGWKPFRTNIGQRNDTVCRAFDPDVSAFTITGKAEAGFANERGESVISVVEVFESRADAVGDFRAAARPAVVRCLREAIADDARNGSSGLKVRVLSARMTGAPRVGERAAAWRLLARIDAEGVSARMYIDLLAFGRGRSLAALMFTGVQQPLAGQAALARHLAARMR